MVCEARLAAMGIPYEDEREDVADRHFVAMFVRLTIIPTMRDRIRQAQAIDQLLE